MNIIKQGRKHLTIKFKCRCCGTVFTEEAKYCKFIEKDDGTGQYWVSRCPNCYNNVHSYDIQHEDYDLI